MASVITIIIGVVMCISFIISAVIVNSARTYHSSVIEQIEASDFEEATIEKCVKDAENNKYILKVEKTSTPESKSTSLYKVTLNYGLYAPIFGKIHKGELVGYALAGARVGDGNSDAAEDVIVPGLYETGSNYTKLLKSWDELVSEGVVSVTDGVVTTGYTSGDNASSEKLAGDLMLPYDGSVTDVGYLAFFKCTELTGVKIPESVKIIGQQAFAGCWELTTVELSKGVELIDYGAFDYDGMINTVIYNGSAEEWCKITFDNWQSNPAYYGAVLHLTDEPISNICNLIVPSAVSSLENKFTGCGSLLSVIIPDNTEMKVLDDYAFGRCSNLKRVRIGSGVEKIGQNAFLECDLELIMIPASVVEIDSYALNYCSLLTDIYYEGTMEQWGDITFGSDWDQYTGEYTVHCSDGDIAKS